MYRTITDKDECPALPNPANGQVELLLVNGQLLPESLAIYSCDVGFRPSGIRFRECTSNHVWSGLSPTCVKGEIYI